MTETRKPGRRSIRPAVAAAARAGSKTSAQDRRAPVKRTAAGKGAAKRPPAKKDPANKGPAKKGDVRGSAGAAAAKTARRKSAAPTAPSAAVVKVVLAALEELKAVNVQVLDVRGITDIADTMIIASGNSDRHVRSIAERVVTEAKQAGHRPNGVEGGRDGEWVLVDLGDVVAHIMLPRVREFYRLESLWDVGSARQSNVGT